jgi:hypothetical protein
MYVSSLNNAGKELISSNIHAVINIQHMCNALYTDLPLPKSLLRTVHLAPTAHINKVSEGLSLVHAITY